jgi:hypothetical protein
MATSEVRRAFILVLVFTVPIQTVAAVFAVLSRDTPGGTTFGLFAATWAVAFALRAVASHLLGQRTDYQS